MAIIVDLERKKIIKTKRADECEYGKFIINDEEIFVKYEQINMNENELKKRIIEIIHTYDGLIEPKGNDNGRPI